MFIFDKMTYMCNFTIYFFLMIRRPPRSTRTDTLFPYTTLVRSGRAVIAFDPEFGIRQVAKQRPAARSVPASDLPTLGHGGQERVSVLFGYPIFDSDDDRAGPAPHGNGRIGFVEALQVAVPVFGLGPGKPAAADDAAQLDGRGDPQRRRQHGPFRDITPPP